MNYYTPEVTSTPHSLCVKAPYNQSFSTIAKSLGGVFEDGAWVFNRRDEISVRDELEKLYGYDGLTEPAKCDVSIAFTADCVSPVNGTLWILARPLARAYKDSESPQIALGTVVSQGKIEVEHKKVICRKDTIVIFRDVPISLVDREPAGQGYSLSIIEPTEIQLECLFYEHDRNLARIKEINRIFELAKTDLEKFGEHLALTSDRH